MAHKGGPLAQCAVCGLSKKPWGRSAPLGMANGLCDHDCEGYDKAPVPDGLWPDEECWQCAEKEAT